jgi:hypothetical protein
MDGPFAILPERDGRDRMLIAASLDRVSTMSVLRLIFGEDGGERSEQLPCWLLSPNDMTKMSNTELGQAIRRREPVILLNEPTARNRSVIVNS